MHSGRVLSGGCFLLLLCVCVFEKEDLCDVGGSMCVCMHVRAYVRVHTCVCVCVFVCASMCVCVSLYVCVCGVLFFKHSENICIPLNVAGVALISSCKHQGFLWWRSHSSCHITHAAWSAGAGMYWCLLLLHVWAHSHDSMERRVVCTIEIQLNVLAIPYDDGWRWNNLVCFGVWLNWPQRQVVKVTRTQAII